MGPAGFPKGVRLRKRSEFLRIQGAGLKVPTPHFLGLVQKSSAPTRLGITVSAKVGIAVVRNRIRRVVREWFRSRRMSLAPGWDVVVVARTQAAQADAAALRGSLEALWVELQKRDK